MPHPPGEALSVPVFPDQPLDQNPAAVYLGLLGPGSRRVQQTALQAALRHLTAAEAPLSHPEAVQRLLGFPWHHLRYQHTARLRQLLVDSGYRPATVNRILCAVRGVLGQAWRLGLMSTDDYHRTRDVASLPTNSLLAGRALSHGEIGALLRACFDDERPAGARDAALLAVLYGAGLRRFEAAGLELRDFVATDNSLTVRKAKHDHQRVVYLPDGARTALDAWLALRGDQDGPLFCPVTQRGEVVPRSMTGQAIYYLLARRARKAGLRDLSPHDLRRSFVTHLLGAGADVLSVQRLAGHKDAKTTLRYDRRGEEAKKASVQLLHVPIAAPRLPRPAVRPTRGDAARSIVAVPSPLESPDSHTAHPRT